MPALEHTKPPIQWVPGVLSVGSGRGVKLTTHLQLVPKSRMRGAISPLPQYFFMAWFSVKHRDNFTFTFTHITEGLGIWYFVNTVMNLQFP